MEVHVENITIHGGIVIIANDGSHFKWLKTKKEIRKKIQEFIPLDVIKENCPLCN